MLTHHTREISIGVAIFVLGVALRIAAPGYFTGDNVTDLFLANLPVLIIALGMTLVILTGEIDISVGSVFAVCGVIAGTVAKWDVPMVLVMTAACAAGAMFGLINGALVGYLGIPSIVVTLAVMIATRDALRWVTQGAWVQDLPAHFQWIGLSQHTFPIAAVLTGASLAIVIAWTLRYTPSGRAVYLTGSDADAARLAGVNTSRLKATVFACAGALTGLAAVLNSVRFNQIPVNAGVGLEMKVIAAVVVGGAAITGGRGTVFGTLLGVLLLGAIGPALTFLGVTAYWERAMQGGIILIAVVFDATAQRAAMVRHDVAAAA